jgi:cytochrome b subunit of formate dehydrogenase
VFCIYLKTNSDLCHLQHKLIGFYNPDLKSLQRGTDWVFKYSGLRLVFKGVNIYFRTNSDFCHLQHKLIGFYNPDEKVLHPYTDWVFK